MAKVKIIGGDIHKGTWHFSSVLGSASIYCPSTPDHPMKGERIDMKTEVDRIEQLNEESVKKLAGMAGWGIAGAVVAGPLGAIGGMLLGGNRKDVAFACYLTDGRKFMATTDSGTWNKIIAARF